TLRGARRPLVVVGAGAAAQPGVAAAVARLAASLPALVTREWNGLCTLQTAAGRTAALDVGYTSCDLDSARFVYLLGADGAAARLPPGAFVVYQGHHGDAGAHAADVVLPAAAYTEKAATFVNTEGRTQRTRQAVAAPGAARDDWKIIRALSDAAGLPLPYDDVSGLRARMADVCPSLVAADVLEPTSPEVALLALSRLAKSSAPASDAVLASVIGDYYMTDAISRASRTMAKASAAANGRLASGSDSAKAEAMRM
ncbi:ndufs1 NADH-ubiquinone oxidoreductase subunit, partial [Coemansia sp. S85]